LGATRALGLFDFKNPPQKEEYGHVESKYKENYLYAKPDIFVHKLSKEDDFAFITNSQFGSIFQTHETVTSFLSKAALLKGNLSMAYTTDKIKENFMKKSISKDSKIKISDSVMLAIVLNMTLLEG